MHSATQNQDPLLGFMLRGYVIEALIGEGSAARVYRARCPITDEVVAIKLMPNSGSAARVERMRREALALSRIQHPNVVHLHDFGTTQDGWTYLIMELVPGVTLGSIIQQHAPLSPRSFWELGRQLAEGLAAAHESGVVHRDLKPSNVLVVGQGSSSLVRLVDFGLVRAASEDRRLTANQVLLGTPLYMAPEQMLNPHEVTPSSDLYSLGVIYYEMLSGRAPFVGTLLGVLEQHQQEAPRPLESRGGFETLCFALLEKSPADRPRDARTVVQILDEIWDHARGRRGSRVIDPGDPAALETVVFAADAEVTLPPEDEQWSPTLIDHDTRASLLGTLEEVPIESFGTRILLEEDFAPKVLPIEPPAEEAVRVETRVLVPLIQPPMQQASAHVRTALSVVFLVLTVLLGWALQRP